MNRNPELLDAILQSSPDGVLTVDDTGRIRTANARAHEIFGYTPPELLGLSCDDLVPASVRESHARSRLDWFESPAPRDMGSSLAPRGLRKDGTEFPLKISLRPLPPPEGRRLVACWLREETDSVSMARQLRAQNAVAHVIASAATLEEAAPQILRAICETLGWDLGMLWTSRPDISELRLRHAWPREESPFAGFIRRCEDRVFSPEEGVIGLAWSRRAPTWIPELSKEKSFLRSGWPEARGLVSMVVVPILFAGRLLGAMELFSRCRRPAEPETVMLLTGLGSILGEFIDRMRVTEELKRREEQVRQSEKLESIGRLAGGIAHDFNNMLTAILGFTEELMDRLGPGFPHRGELEEIHKAAERSATLTRQLLAFGRKQMLQPKVLDLSTTLQAMAPMLRRLLGETVELTATPLAAPGTVRVDPGQIEQVVLNLVLNARDAMPAGGKVLVETVNVSLDEEYTRRHPGVKPGPYVMLAVTDSGQGMDEATRAQIFEPFFTTKAVGRGTGLGLATIHGIVNQSLGHIWVYSEPGRGTTFKVYFPRVFEEVAKEAHTVVRNTRGNEAILVIEDEEVVLRMIRSVLEAAGYRVVVAGDGPEALAALKANAGSLALVISDVVLPGTNARQLSEQIRAEVPGLPFLFMSGYTENAIFHQGVLDQGLDFLGKPFSPRTLLETVRGILDRRR